MTMVMLVDDHRLFSASLAMALRNHGFEVDTPVLTSVDDVANRILETRPDLAIIDRDLGALGSGESLIRGAVDAHVPVIVVTGALDDVVAGRCYSRGAAACLSKSQPLEELLSAAASLADGRQAVANADRYRCIDAWRRWQASADAAAGPFAQLTGREAAVLRALMDGRSVRTIATSSAVSETTVRSQVRCILSKLGVSSQLEAVAMALRAGWPGSLGPGDVIHAWTGAAVARVVRAHSGRHAGGKASLPGGPGRG